MFLELTENKDEDESESKCIVIRPTADLNILRRDAHIEASNIIFHSFIISQ